MKRLSSIGEGVSMAVGLLLWLASASTASAQSAPAPSFGVDSESSVVVTAWDMQPSVSTTTWAEDESAFRYATEGTAGGVFRAGVTLPNGALITRIELEGCDASIEGGITAALYRSTPANVLASVAEDVAGVPGCGRIGADLETPETVDNTANRYLVSAATTAFDGSASLGAVRVYYKLQVSPAPATATFLDVPTDDPAFQFVEALVASGITAGCGSGNYCPDAPLTRRQMAVFISKGLGLHWGENAPAPPTGGAR